MKRPLFFWFVAMATLGLAACTMEQNHPDDFTKDGHEFQSINPLTGSFAAENEQAINLGKAYLATANAGHAKLLYPNLAGTVSELLGNGLLLIGHEVYQGRSGTIVYDAKPVPLLLPKSIDISLEYHDFKPLNPPVGFPETTLNGKIKFKVAVNILGGIVLDEHHNPDIDMSGSVTASIAGGVKNGLITYEKGAKACEIIDDHCKLLSPRVGNVIVTIPTATPVRLSIPYDLLGLPRPKTDRAVAVTAVKDTYTFIKTDLVDKYTLINQPGTLNKAGSQTIKGPLSGQFVYTGTMDEDGKTLHIKGEYQSFVGKTADGGTYKVTGELTSLSRPVNGVDIQPITAAIEVTTTVEDGSGAPKVTTIQYNSNPDYKGVLFEPFAGTVKVGANNAPPITLDYAGDFGITPPAPVVTDKVEAVKVVKRYIESINVGLEQIKLINKAGSDMVGNETIMGNGGGFLEYTGTASSDGAIHIVLNQNKLSFKDPSGLNSYTLHGKITNSSYLKAGLDLQTMSNNSEIVEVIKDGANLSVTTVSDIVSNTDLKGTKGRALLGGYNLSINGAQSVSVDLQKDLGMPIPVAIETDKQMALDGVKKAFAVLQDSFDKSNYLNKFGTATFGTEVITSSGGGTMTYTAGRNADGSSSMKIVYDKYRMDSRGGYNKTTLGKGARDDDDDQGDDEVIVSGEISSDSADDEDDQELSLDNLLQVKTLGSSVGYSQDKTNERLIEITLPSGSKVNKLRLTQATLKVSVDRLKPIQISVPGDVPAMVVKPIGNSDHTKALVGTKMIMDSLASIQKKIKPLNATTLAGMSDTYTVSGDQGNAVYVGTLKGDGSIGFEITFNAIKINNPLFARAYKPPVLNGTLSGTIKDSSFISDLTMMIHGESQMTPSGPASLATTVFQASFAPGATGYRGLPVKATVLAKVDGNRFTSIDIPKEVAGVEIPTTDERQVTLDLLREAFTLINDADEQLTIVHGTGLGKETVFGSLFGSLVYEGSWAPNNLDKTMEVHYKDWVNADPYVSLDGSYTSEFNEKTRTPKTVGTLSMTKKNSSIPTQILKIILESDVKTAHSSTTWASGTISAKVNQGTFYSFDIAKNILEVLR